MGDLEYPGSCVSSHALYITLALILLLERCAMMPLQTWTFSACLLLAVWVQVNDFQ